MYNLLRTHRDVYAWMCTRSWNVYVSRLVIVMAARSYKRMHLVLTLTINAHSIIERGVEQSGSCGTYTGTIATSSLSCGVMVGLNQEASACPLDHIPEPLIFAFCPTFEANSVAPCKWLHCC